MHESRLQGLVSCQLLILVLGVCEFLECCAFLKSYEVSEKDQFSHEITFSDKYIDIDKLKFCLLFWHFV